MMRGLVSGAAAGPLDPWLAPGKRPAWLGGFNLMPHRQRDARLARRRCLFEWLAAALAGGMAVLMVIGWQALERKRVDAQRVSVDRTLVQLSAPLAEHAALLHAQDERRKGAARSVVLSEPLLHLRDLLDALSFESGDGVVLRQLRHREYETELLATSAGHTASAGWLERLTAIRGVKGSEVSDLRRATPATNTATTPARGRETIAAHAALAGPGQIEFGARLRWTDPPQKTARTAAPDARRPSQSDQSRGVQ